MRAPALRGRFGRARPDLRLLLSAEESAALRALMRGAQSGPPARRPRRLTGWWRRFLTWLRRRGRKTLLEQIERDRGRQQ